MDKLPILKIDPEFKDLIRPLRRKEYLQLEENILDEGCRDPIIIWKGKRNIKKNAHNFVFISFALAIFFNCIFFSFHICVS